MGLYPNFPTFEQYSALIFKIIKQLSPFNKDELNAAV